jgi:hypothetical protein
MDTLGTTAVTILKIAESYSINRSFVAAAAIQRGIMVRLTVTGEVEAIADPTTRPLGLVVAGSRNAGERVTVQTDFSAIVRCTADGSITTGGQLSCTGVSGSGDGLAKYKTAVATNYISGIALEDAANGESFLVGITRTSTIKA